MTSTEMHHSIRVLLLDVLEQCARRMEAMPRQRKQFQPIAYAVHAALEDFERKFRLGTTGDRSRDQMLLTRAQDMSLEWLHTIQELSSEQSSPAQWEPWPLWGTDGLGETQGAA